MNKHKKHIHVNIYYVLFYYLCIFEVFYVNWELPRDRGQYCIKMHNNEALNMITYI